MLKGKIAQIILFVLMLIISVVVAISMQLPQNFPITGTFANVVYFTMKVFALFTILALIYFKVINSPKGNDMILMYATVVVQIVPLAVRLILSTPKLPSWWVVLSVVIVVLSIASFIGLYVFSEVEVKEELSE